MDETLVIPVKRETRRSETVMRRVMAVLAVVFLLQGIMLSTAFMLPCFLMTLAYFWYGFAMKREYEYTLEDGQIRNLAMPVWNWQRLYQSIIRSVVTGAFSGELQ